MDPFLRLARALIEAHVSFVVIGVWGATYYATSASMVFRTEDRVLFLPADPNNFVRRWAACEAVGLELRSEREPLDKPRDWQLAERVVSRRALIRATDGADLDFDLTLVMAGFEFSTVRNERRLFVVEGVDIPVARLQPIVASKHAAGRDKDRLLLATYRDALEQLLRREQ